MRAIRKALFAVMAGLSLVAMPSALAGVSADFGDGSLKLGTATDDCDATTIGGLRYNTTDNVVEYCNASAWVKLIPEMLAAASVPNGGDGYFVITSATWDGALGDLAGADAKCLSDLTANDWMGKTDATTRGLINDGHVSAFLCNTRKCQNALPSVEYFFAVSGDNTKGGASFIATAAGLGPGDSNNWSGATYFDGAKRYWVGRTWNPSSNTLWDDAANANGFEICMDYRTNDNNGSWYGGYGSTNTADSNRFYDDKQLCNLTAHILCFVHP